MHQQLERALKELGLTGQLPVLTEADAISDQLISQSRGFLTERVPPEVNVKLDVVALGSVARHEASAASDFDYLVVVYELLPESSVSKTREILEAADELVEKELRLKPPGGQGMFGTVIAAPDLTERIGLENDTNLTHSRRMLLLEESVSIYRPELHRELIRAVLKRYLIDYEGSPKAGVPRFLLNDVERYWRTLCVDYQAKRWTLRRQGWGLRYLKLVISRKLAYVGTVTSLLLCDDARVDKLEAAFALPPLARLAQLVDVIADASKPALVEVFQIAENFASSLADQGFRTAVGAVTSRQETITNSAFSEARLKAKRMQECLQEIFFEDPALATLSRQYLTF